MSVCSLRMASIIILLLKHSYHCWMGTQTSNDKFKALWYTVSFAATAVFTKLPIPKCELSMHNHLSVIWMMLGIQICSMVNHWQADAFMILKECKTIVHFPRLMVVQVVYKFAFLYPLTLIGHNYFETNMDENNDFVFWKNKLNIANMYVSHYKHNIINNIR